MLSSQFWSAEFWCVNIWLIKDIYWQDLGWIFSYVQDIFFTLKVHLSTQEYEWVQEIEDCLENLTNCLTSFQEEQIHILL